MKAMFPGLKRPKVSFDEVGKPIEDGWNCKRSAKGHCKIKKAFEKYVRVQQLEIDGLRDEGKPVGEDGESEDEDEDDADLASTDDEMVVPVKAGVLRKKKGEDHWYPAAY